MRDTMREVDTGGLGWVPREDSREELNTQELGTDSDSDSDDDVTQGDDPAGDDFGAGAQTSGDEEGRVDVEGLDFGDGALDEDLRHEPSAFCKVATA